MATVKAFIRTTKKKAERVNIRFRLTDGRSVQLFYKSEIEVSPDLWDGKNERYKTRALIMDDERLMFNKRVSDRKNLLNEIYNQASKEGLTSEIFSQIIDQALHPEKYKPVQESLFDAYDVFVDKKKVSNTRYKNYAVIKRILKRYELFKALDIGKSFTLTFDILTPDLLEDLHSFIRNEHTLCDEKKYKPIYDIVKESRPPKQRGHNRMVEVMKKIRAFINWANDTDRTTINPFKKYSIPAAVYGTPIYITKAERDKIYQKDLSDRPDLAVQRDIFIFQCVVGCRVGDFMKLTPANIINGAVEYIPSKMIDERPETVRVPLINVAKEILNRYEGQDKRGRILPFISEQRYNDKIKEIFEIAGITRMVTLLNPTTGMEEKRPINEIASSHMARRTFAGNIYKEVKDPNLVGKLTGHKEGSKAFARYRDIDEELRIETVKHLE